jgi:hypothetical protein
MVDVQTKFHAGVSSGVDFDFLFLDVVSSTILFRYMSDKAFVDSVASSSVNVTLVKLLWVRLG